MPITKHTLKLSASALGSVLFIAMAVAGLIHGSAADSGKPPADDAVPVPVVAVIKKAVPVYLDYAGRAEAMRSVSLQAKISGYLQSREAADGADIEAGDLLYRIDPRDYRATLDQIRAQAARADAALALARINKERGQTLVKQGWIAKEAYDERTSSLQQADATLAADKAAVETAEINLSYTEIRAPFAGRLGRSLVHEGALISTADTTLNTLVQLDPIYASFNPTDADLAQIEKYRSNGPIAVEVTGPSSEAQSGTLTFLDNAIDSRTGTITARATIANQARALLPGQYVRIRLHLTDDPDALLVPQTAVGSNQLGKFVYIIGKDSKAEQHVVTLGASNEDQVVVTKGVQEGDMIIAGNLQKVSPGTAVRPVPAQNETGS